MTVNRREDGVAKLTAPEVVVYVCRNCIPRGGRLPQQWKQDGLRVCVRTMPCSGKIDGQYLFHALESGAAGLCVVARPKGDCTLAQGNYRAEVRIRTVQRLLCEIDLDARRASLLHFSSTDPPERLGEMVRGVVSEISALGANPIREGSAVESSSA